jgi:hypothetical protein
LGDLGTAKYNLGDMAQIQKRIRLGTIR